MSKYYKVDITKPPIGPPCREIYYGIFTYRKARKSAEKNKDWKIYIKEYGQELEESKNE